MSAGEAQFQVLIVCEDVLLGELLTGLLSARGHSARWARTATEGLSLFLKQKPPLALLDVNLSDMDGLSLLEEMRLHEPGARVIVLAAKPEEEVEREARRLGAADFLRRGLGVEVIVASIERLLAPEDLWRGGAAGPKVLVVEDDSGVRDFLEEHLVSEGYCTLTAADGEEGLERMKAAPDLVLLDLALPKLSGLEVLRRVARFPEPPPIVVITGAMDEEIRRKSVELGAFDLLGKPIQLRELGVVMRAALVLRSRRRSGLSA